MCAPKCVPLRVLARMFSARVFSNRCAPRNSVCLKLDSARRIQDLESQWPSFTPWVDISSLKMSLLEQDSLRLAIVRNEAMCANYYDEDSRPPKIRCCAPASRALPTKPVCPPALEAFQRFSRVRIQQCPHSTIPSAVCTLSIRPYSKYVLWVSACTYLFPSVEVPL
ncbi:unnamed protein product [Cyclocybe aegerita]|uniref:Uncharacterized protein n=1 Tax=Cyclocybe aegerita TaxID=1973307 RepID=A0A8S0WLZ4_CYCAE|nr:unnamed protein product [Cyclocybe aegerita]